MVKAWLPAQTYSTRQQLYFKDKRYKYGMALLIDLLSATLDFELQDLRRALTETNHVKEKGLEPEQIIILSQSTGIHLAC